jgi:hypothetical protein
LNFFPRFILFFAIENFHTYIYTTIYTTIYCIRDHNTMSTIETKKKPFPIESSIYVDEEEDTTWDNMPECICPDPTKCVCPAGCGCDGCLEDTDEDDD